MRQSGLAPRRRNDRNDCARGQARLSRKIAREERAVDEPRLLRGRREPDATPRLGQRSVPLLSSQNRRKHFRRCLEAPDR
jgi:hypothetical protein